MEASNSTLKAEEHTIHPAPPEESQGFPRRARILYAINLALAEELQEEAFIERNTDVMGPDCYKPCRGHRKSVVWEFVFLHQSQQEQGTQGKGLDQLIFICLATQFQEMIFD